MRFYLLHRLKFYLNNIIVTKDQLKELYYLYNPFYGKDRSTTKVYILWPCKVIWGFLYSDTTDRSFLFHILFSYVLFYVTRLKKKKNLGTVLEKKAGIPSSPLLLLKDKATRLL